MLEYIKNNAVTWVLALFLAAGAIYHNLEKEKLQQQIFTLQQERENGKAETNYLGEHLPQLLASVSELRNTLQTLSAESQDLQGQYREMLALRSNQNDESPDDVDEFLKRNDIETKTQALSARILETSGEINELESGVKNWGKQVSDLQSRQSANSSNKQIVIPSGASAICRDGTYSFSQSRRGTCSHHGGVAKWLY